MSLIAVRAYLRKIVVVERGGGTVAVLVTVTVAMTGYNSNRDGNSKGS